MFGMTSTIRIGVPTATDPEGTTGPGYWWLTGSARPGLTPTSQRRAIRRAKRAGHRLLAAGVRHSGSGAPLLWGYRATPVGGLPHRGTDGGPVFAFITPRAKRALAARPVPRRVVDAAGTAKPASSPLGGTPLLSVSRTLRRVMVIGGWALPGGAGAVPTPSDHNACPAPRLRSARPAYPPAEEGSALEQASRDTRTATAPADTAGRRSLSSPGNCTVRRLGGSCNVERGGAQC